jgi:chromosome segregation ATPase
LDYPSPRRQHEQERGEWEAISEASLIEREEEERLRGERDAAVCERDAARAERDAVARERDDARGERDALSHSISALRLEAEITGDALARRDADLEVLRGEREALFALRRQHEGVRGEGDALRATVERLEGALRDEIGVREDLERSKLTLKEAIAELERTLTRVTEPLTLNP